MKKNRQIIRKHRILHEGQYRIKDHLKSNKNTSEITTFSLQVRVLGPLGIKGNNIKNKKIIT